MAKPSAPGDEPGSHVFLAEECKERGIDLEQAEKLVQRIAATGRSEVNVRRQMGLWLQLGRTLEQIEARELGS